MLIRFSVFAATVVSTIVAAGASPAAHNAQAWLGSWAFELPDGNPVWLQLAPSDEALEAALLWSVGSARPVQGLKLTGPVLSFERKLRWKPFGAEGQERAITEPMTARLDGERLVLTVRQTPRSGGAEETLVLQGKRMPPMPPPPDLSRVRFGRPIELFNGRDLTGWALSDPNKKNGWRVEQGVLKNVTPKTDFSAYGEYGNLRTTGEFKDFRLSLEYNVAAGGNSGVYLRGLYEAQVVDRDSRMQGIDGPGAIFGRIAPSKNAGRAGGSWNTYELTLVDRHISVVLNGEKVIDNQPVAGCTGGALSADDTAPGPILLQGDHTSVAYRKLVLTPVLTTN